MTILTDHDGIVTILGNIGIARVALLADFEMGAA